MLQNPCIRYDKHLKQSLHPQPEQSINMILMETQAQMMMMMGTMLMKDLHLMELILNLMTSTTSTLPVSIGILRLSP